MAANYGKHFSTIATPQTEAIPGKAMVKNSAGGYAFQIDDWKRLERFLILGCEGGTWYAKERDLTIENAECVLRCIQQDGINTVAKIVEVSEQGRAPKNDAAIFALAICAGKGDEKTRQCAMSALPKVCRIGTHLFQFHTAVRQFRGGGSCLNKGIARWYTSKDENDLAYQVIKYQQRDGVSHRDVLRLVRPRKWNTALARWIINGSYEERAVTKWTKDGPKTEFKYEYAVPSLPDIVMAFEQMKKTTDVKEVVALIDEYDLPRECVMTQWLNEPKVWEALLQRMPGNALVRNLGKMSAVGLTVPLSAASKLVCKKLTDQEYIKRSRLHPLSILNSLNTYKEGRGDKGSLTWSPVPQIVDALDAAFYLAFQNVEPTGKNFMLGIDVSGSMTSKINGTNISCCMAATALAMCVARVESDYVLCGFDQGLRELPISAKSRLADAMKYTENINGGGTDCALPMLAATEKKVPIDVFLVITDSETWAGRMQPCQALVAYRKKMNRPNAKLIVAALTSTGFSIADPSDSNQLDIVGYDTAMPNIISEFAKM